MIGAYTCAGAGGGAATSCCGMALLEFTLIQAWGCWRSGGDRGADVGMTTGCDVCCMMFVDADADAGGGVRVFGVECRFLSGRDGLPAAGMSWTERGDETDADVGVDAPRGESMVGWELRRDVAAPSADGAGLLLLECDGCISTVSCIGT